MKDSPDPLTELNPKPTNITETNHVPIILAVVFLVGLILALLFRAEPEKKKEESGEQKISQTVRSDDGREQFWFNDDAHKKIRINPSEAVNSPEAVERGEKAVLTREEAKYRQSLVEMDYANKYAIAEMQRKHELEEKQMEYEAMKAPIDVGKIGVLPSFQKGVQGAVLSSGGSFKDSTAGAPSQGATESARPREENTQDAKEAFLNKQDGRTGYLTAVKKRPLSPFELKAGTYIPAALVTGIQSDLPGPVVAQVTSNVYDSASGQYLLIPQGAKLVGEYDSHVSFGQNRALVVWNRMVFPDGATLDLDRMQGVDMAGYAGFYDKVDNHYLRIYANAFMLSLVGAGYELLNKKANTSSTPSAQDTVAASVGQRLADVSSQTMERNLSVQPTIIIRPGFQFNVVVVKDVVLEDMSP